MERVCGSETDSFIQLPRRALGHILPLRRQGHRLWLRRCTGRARQRVPQVCCAFDGFYFTSGTNTFYRSLTLKEAETLTLRTLKQVMEEKLDAKNVQLSSITKDKGFRIYTDEEMKECVGQLEGN